MKKYKAVIVGCGNIAGGYDEKGKDKKSVFTHAGAYRKNKIDIAAASDTNEKRLTEFAKIWGVKKTYSDYREMLKKEKSDIVSVCVPNELHEAVVIYAAENSPAKIIFCEKPLSTSVASAKRMTEACKKHGKALIVNYQRRWEPMHIEAKRMIENGTIGQVQGITGYFMKGLLHVGTHLTNTIRFFVGEPENVYSTGNDVVMVFKGGYKAFLISADKGGYAHSTMELDIMGSKGRVRFSENSNIFEFFQAEDYKKYPGMGFRMLYLKEKKETKMGLAIAEGIKEIVEILDGKKQSSANSAEEAIKDLEIVEEAEGNKVE